MPEPAAVRSMFARIAGRYDLLNRGLSLGVDQRWRKAAVDHLLPLEGRIGVDACCGTGDLSLALARAGAKVVGIDFTPEMIERAGPKLTRGKNGIPGKAHFACGDALRLPVAARSLDFCTVAFGIRNVADRAAGMAEMVRVVRPGGTVLILEFTTPPGRAFGALYRFYFTQALPRVGRLVSRDDEAYSYLPRTVLEWPSPEVLRDEMRATGLVDCGFERLTGGIACLHWGRVSPG